MPPGVLVVWSGTAPCLAALQVPADGLIFGRDLLAQAGLTDDDRIGRTHCRIERLPDSFLVEDLGSRNGTYVNRGHVLSVVEVHRRAVLRVGRTVALLVGELPGWAAAEVVDGLALGPITRPLRARAVELAAGDRSVVFVGSNATGRATLANHFARSRGGEVAVLPDTWPRPPIASVVTADTRTLVVPTFQRMSFAQYDEISALLDRPRFALATTSQIPLDPKPDNAAGALVRKLAIDVVDVPPLANCPLERLAFLHARATLPVHATAAEIALTYDWPGNWLELGSDLDAACDSVERRNGDSIRGDDLDGAIRADHTLFAR